MVIWGDSTTSLARTQAHYHFPANIRHHNLHLSCSHNGQLVGREWASLPDPRRTVCRGLISSMGRLYLQGETAGAKQGWHREGTVWARGKSMGDPPLVSWSNTTSLKWGCWQTESKADGWKEREEDWSHACPMRLNAHFVAKLLKLGENWHETVTDRQKQTIKTIQN